MYQFADLTAEQQHERRYLLDFYAALAQISVFVPLILALCYRLGAWTVERRRRAARLQTPSSPYLKENRLGFQARFTRDLKNTVDVLRWWCCDPVEIAGFSLGTKGELFGASLWLAWLMLLCFLQTGDDYLHLTKRFGIIAGSQFPLHYLLSMKSPYSPIQLLTNTSHETLIGIHQIIGRIITAFVYLHAIFYLNFYVQKDLLLAKLREFYVLCGIFAVVAFTTIGITSLSLFRDRRYNIFYVVHVVLASLLLPTLYFHVSHVRIYLYESAVIYLISSALRALRTRTVNADLKLLPESSGLLSITIPIPQANLRHTSWQAGQHGYLSSPKRWSTPNPFFHPSNPFTAASLPALDGDKLQFVARVLGGRTAELARSAMHTQKLAIEGPYGASDHVVKLLGYDRVLFIAGGVGATFIVPLYRQLLADLSPGPGTHRRQRVNFCWVVKGLRETEWAVPAEGKEREGFIERLSVYVTRVSLQGTLDGSRPVVTEGEGAEGDNWAADGEEGIELQERKTLLADAGDQYEGVAAKGIAVHKGRPDLGRMVEQMFSHSAIERVAVVVCGPRSLGQAVRREVGVMVKKGRDVFFWEEAFAL